MPPQPEEEATRWKCLVIDHEIMDNVVLAMDDTIRFKVCTSRNLDLILSLLTREGHPWQSPRIPFEQSPCKKIPLFPFHNNVSLSQAPRLEPRVGGRS